MPRNDGSDEIATIFRLRRWFFGMGLCVIGLGDRVLLLLHRDRGDVLRHLAVSATCGNLDS